MLNNAEKRRIVELTEEAMLPLGPARELRNGQWIQHRVDTCHTAKANLLRILREYSDFEPLHRPDDKIDPSNSIITRYIGDSGDSYTKEWADAWYRLANINWGTFREYSQPYFVRYAKPEEIDPTPVYSYANPAPTGAQRTRSVTL